MTPTWRTPTGSQRSAPGPELSSAATTRRNPSQTATPRSTLQLSESTPCVRPSSSITERFRPGQRVPSAQSLVPARGQVRRTGSDDTVRAVVETLVRNRALGERIARYPGSSTRSRDVPRSWRTHWNLPKPNSSPRPTTPTWLPNADLRQHRQVDRYRAATRRPFRGSTKPGGLNRCLRAASRLSGEGLTTEAAGATQHRQVSTHDHSHKRGCLAVFEQEEPAAPPQADVSMSIGGSAARSSLRASWTCQSAA